MLQVKKYLYKRKIIDRKQEINVLNLRCKVKMQAYAD